MKKKYIILQVLCILSMLIWFSCNPFHTQSQSSANNFNVLDEKDAVKATVALTIYVSPSGSDSNNGTIDSPFATIQKAVDLSVSGSDVIFLRAGTYNQTTSISNKTGITITAYSGEKVIIDGTGATYRQFFMVANTSNLTITGLTMQNLGIGYARAIYVFETEAPASSNLTFSNNIITQINATGTKYAPGYSTSKNSGSNAILVAGGIDGPGNAITNVAITGNRVSQCEVGFSEAVTIKGNINGFLVADNTVQDISNIGIDAAGLETWPVLTDATCVARNGIIRNNTVSNCVNSYSDCGAIYDDGGNNISILCNRVYNNQYGINIGVENQMSVTNAATYNIEVRNNLIYNNRLAGLLMGTNGSGTTGGLVTNCNVVGNTFLKNGQSTSHEVFLQKLSNVAFTDNIFYLKDGSRTLGYVGSGGAAVSALTFDYCIYYNGVTPVTVLLMGKALTAWGNAHSIYADPMLTNASTTSANPALLPGSPAINTGNPDFIALSGETDYFDNTRILGGRVDMGCAESGGSAIP